MVEYRSGSGKSRIAYEIARFYGVNVLEVDDVHLSVKTVTTKEHFPVIHYWDSIKVKSIFIHESDKNQIVQNYLAREGGEL